MITKDELLIVASRLEMYGIDTLGEFLAYFNGWDRGICESTGESSLFMQFQPWITRRFNVPPNVAWTGLVLEKFGNTRAGIFDFVAVLDAFFSEQRAIG